MSASVVEALMPRLWGSLSKLSFARIKSSNKIVGLKYNDRGGDRSPPPVTLCVDQLVIYDLHCPVPDVVHSLHPQHLILCFELFGDAFALCHLLRQQEH